MAELIARARGLRADRHQGADDSIGIVTVHDGPSLPPGEIIAPTVGDDPRDADTYHNNFQDPEQFLARAAAAAASSRCWWKARTT